MAELSNDPNVLIRLGFQATVRGNIPEETVRDLFEHVNNMLKPYVDDGVIPETVDGRTEIFQAMLQELQNNIEKGEYGTPSEVVFANEAGECDDPNCTCRKGGDLE